MSQKITSYECQNCLSKQDEKLKYCSTCGQKRRKKILSFNELMEDFSSMVFNLDTKIYHTLRASFIPGKLTIEYCNGIRSKYYQPFRLFFIAAILFFWLLSLTNLFDNFHTSLNGEKIENTEYIFTSINALDSIRDSVITSFEDPRFVHQVIDSIQMKLSEKIDDSVNILSLKDSIVVAHSDLYTLTPDEVIAKYDVKDLVGRVFIKQFTKIKKDPKKFSWYIVSNLIWMLILLLPIFAAIQKLIYFKKGKFYVEHLILLLHTHASVFIICSIAIAIALIVSKYIFVFIGILTSIFFVLYTIKKYYFENWFHTIVKYLIGLILYCVLGFVFFIMNLIISFSVF